MKLFIFENLEKMSFNYHSNGGIVVIAENVEEARMVAEKKINEGKGFLNKHGSDIKIPVDATFSEFSLDGDYASEVFVFPDAGCC